MRSKLLLKCHLCLLLHQLEASPICLSITETGDLCIVLHTINNATSAIRNEQ